LAGVAGAAAIGLIVVAGVAAGSRGLPTGGDPGEQPASSSGAVPTPGTAATERSSPYAGTGRLADAAGVEFGIEPPPGSRPVASDVSTLQAAALFDVRRPTPLRTKTPCNCGQVKKTKTYPDRAVVFVTFNRGGASTCALAR
jgi:hypothetical protein